MTLPTNESVSKLIKSIKTRASNLVRSIQTVAADASEVTSKDGNPYLFTRLLMAVGNGSRRDALVRHIETHTPARLRVTKSQSIKDFVSINGKKYVFGIDKGWKVSDFDTDAMREVNKDTGKFTFPWQDAIKENTPTPLDALKAIKSTVNRYLAGDKPVVAGQEKAVRDVAELLGFEV